MLIVGLGSGVHDCTLRGLLADGIRLYTHGAEGHERAELLQSKRPPNGAVP
jgi:hypothetical protein